MSSAGFILAINFFVAGFFALIFGLIATYDRAYRSARWFSLAYIFGMMSVALEFALPFVSGDPFIIVMMIFCCFLLALISGAVGVARRYAVPAPFGALATILVVGMVVNIYTYGLPHDSMGRMFVYQMPYAITQAVGVVIVFQNCGKRRLDIVTGVFLALSACNYIAKPFIAQAVGGPGVVPTDYIHTAYALYSQTMGAIIAIALGMLFVTVYMRDMLADMRAESQTDRLSGLLNRRGFETQVNALLDRRRGNGIPVCMIICDLDRFKQINDEFGHAAGDRVIEAFSGLLRSTASVDFVIGRIGGEEFAVFMPSANSVVARLFAESVRSTFAGLQIRDLPRLRRFTASFGVAEMVHAEDFSNLLRRADMALYEAKRDGRNRVCVASVPLGLSQTGVARRSFRPRA